MELKHLSSKWRLHAKDFLLPFNVVQLLQKDAILLATAALWQILFKTIICLHTKLILLLYDYVATSAQSVSACHEALHIHKISL